MHLLEINDVDENAAVAEIMTAVGMNSDRGAGRYHTYLGMDSLSGVDSNDYTWYPSGRPHDSDHFSCWYHGEPELWNKEGCVGFFRDSGAGFTSREVGCTAGRVWVDIYCSRKENVMCEL